MVIQPVILSGGSGSRLWPVSRSSYPKQFRQFLPDRHTMLQETALRVRGAANVSGQVLVVCNEAHRFLVAEQLQDVQIPAQIVLEPAARNTAPAVALAALLLERQFGGEPVSMLVMPADHVIDDPAEFMEKAAIGAVAAEEGRLVCFGIIPTNPATGYGYIESADRSHEVSPIRSFVEKPDESTARRLVSSKRFLWNSGIFLMRTDAYLAELRKYAPSIAEVCEASMNDVDASSAFVQPNSEAFERCDSESIDYAVMEHTSSGVVVRLKTGWNDVGSWSALHDVSERDKSGNVVRGDVVALNCKNSLISAEHRLVGAVGVSDLVVVEEKDAVLVTHLGAGQDVKQLVDELKTKQRTEVDVHRRTLQPWGSRDSVDRDDEVSIGELRVNPGSTFLLQERACQARHWIVVRGSVRIGEGKEIVELRVGDSIRMKGSTVCKIENLGNEPARLVEVLCGPEGKEL